MSSERQAARGLRRDVEAVWERIRAEFVLHPDGFWLAFLFGAQASDVDELIARTVDQARTRVRRVATYTLSDRADASEVLANLLARQSAGLAASWVLDEETDPAVRVRLWSGMLRRLNERRDALATAHPAALLLVCPAGSLPMVRDTAPDLWSFRSLTATLAPVADATGVAPAAPHAPSPGHGGLMPVPGSPIQPSPEVGTLLRRAAGALRSGHVDRAVDASLDALDAARNPDDTLLANAWLARVRIGQDDPVSAARHARIALQGGRPLELDTTLTLLAILSDSVDPETTLDAAAAVVELRRELMSRYPDSPTALRDLSVSLNKVAGIQHQRGQLDEALAAFTESLQLRQRIHTDYGETPESLRDLSVSLDKVAGIQRQRGQLDEALAAFTESLQLRQRIHADYGETPQSLRDLTVSLDKVAGIQHQRGQLDEALAAFTESLQLRQRIHTDYGETPQSLRDLSISLNNVARIQQQRDQLDEAP